MTQYNITCGDLIDINNNQILDLDPVSAVDVVGDELSVDELRVEMDAAKGGVYGVLYDVNDEQVFDVNDEPIYAVNPNPTPQSFPYGEEAVFYINGGIQSRGYLTGAKRLTKNKYALVIKSAIGILDEEDHNGGVYDGALFSDVVADIIGSGIQYSVSEDVGNQTVTGWLPIAKRRANLHRLLLAMGASIVRDADGNMSIEFLMTTIAGNIPDARMYTDDSVDAESPATGVKVTEHEYRQLPTTPEVVLFDNSDGGAAANSTRVNFSAAPVHSLRASGLTISESNPNYAIVSGTGTLYGKPYEHNTRIVTRTTAAQNAKPKIVKVEDVGLINALNADNVAERLAAYYGAASKVSADIVFSGEKPGRCYTLTNAYGDQIQGFLAKMELIPSNKIKARCEMVEGYVPVGQGNAYTQYELLTGSGTFTLPANTSARVILVGGGDGGANGGDGEDASRDAPGKGGVGGAGGNGGKILIITFLSTTEARTFAYSCGSGGAVGTAGTDTSFGTYSSSDGATAAEGIKNPLSSDIYGAKGTDGLDGLDGLRQGDVRTTITLGDSTWTSGAKGWSDTVYNRGGGYGGGAAVGSNGGNGGDATYTGGNYYSGAGGKGGDGRNGLVWTRYGYGGGGGHGGGGGGTAGYTDYGLDAGEAGKGGKGGTGSFGRDGCIIVLT